MSINEKKIIKQKKEVKPWLNCFLQRIAVLVKKMRQWLIANKLEFTEVSILENSLFKNDILRILSLTESGVEEIISKRSSAYKNYQKFLILILLL